MILPASSLYTRIPPSPAAPAAWTGSRRSVRDDVEMLEGMQWQVDTRRAPELAPPHAAAVDHDIGGELTSWCNHALDAAPFR